MRLARRGAGLVLAVAAALAFEASAPRIVRADTPDARGARDRDPRAADLKKRGDELLDTKHYAEALAAYDEAYAITPTPVLLYNRGRALQFLGRFPEALEAIERFAAEAPPELRQRVTGLSRLLDELRARIGELVVTSKIAGARVLVNERQIGVTPIGPVRVASGHLAIEVFADGYFPMRRELDLPGNASRAVDFPLVPRDSAGLLIVRSHLPATRVSIDGVALGRAPVEAGLVAGAHRIVAEHDGYDAASTQLLLTAGERREAWLDPSATPPLYARWWFWTAIGVVVVGGVVTYVALTTDSSPPSGDYSPGLVRF